MRPPYLILLAAFAITVQPVNAQISQKCVRLNDPVLANQYLSVASTTDLQGTGSYTLEAWVNPSSYVNFPTIIGNDFAVGYWLGLNTSGGIRFYPRGGVFVDAPGIVPLATWTHIAATYDPVAGYAVYMNGVSVASGATITGPATTSTGDLRLGADRSGGAPNFFWRGMLDDVRIWKGQARTGAQIRETMYQGVPRPWVRSAVYAALQANWEMQSPATTLVFDNAAGLGYSGNSATFVGGSSATISVFDGPPVAFNQGIEFNGTNYAPIPLGNGYASGLTVSAWVCPYSFGADRTIVGRVFTGSFWLGLTATGKIRFYPVGGIGQFFESPSPIVLNRFSHVAATYTDGLACIYVNGALVKTSTAFSGPVGENGRRPWAGADSAGVGPTYGFQGILDEVTVMQGARARPAILEHMLKSKPLDPVSTVSAPDERGVLRPIVTLEFSSFGIDEVFGTNAKLVRSSAPMFDLAPGGLEPGLESFYFLPSLGLAPPETFGISSFNVDLVFPGPTVISDVDVFISAATTDLSQVTLRLTSPTGTVVSLLLPGEGRGRDLQTVFNDEASNTLATGVTPYHRGVRPSQALTTLDGEPASGAWGLTMSAAGGHLVAFAAWGIRFNGLTVDAPVAGAPSRSRLRNAGETVVRSQGQLAFGLAKEAEVRLDLLDLHGRMLRQLLHGRQAAGEYRVGFNAGDFAPGVYFARLQVQGEAPQSAKVIVAR